MRRHHFCLFLICLIGALASLDAAAADEAAAWAALRQAGYVALMRHTEAPGGAGDPPGFRLDDCSTQRNLSLKGREDAKSIGAKLKSEGIVISKLLSSPWCRCVDTAKLMDVGAVELAPSFSNIVVLSDERAVIIERGRKVIDEWAGPGTLLIVTHGANIQALTGGPNPNQGEIVVLDPSSGIFREIGRLAPR